MTIISWEEVREATDAVQVADSPDKLNEWADARRVDLPVLVSVADTEADRALREHPAGLLRAVVASVFIIGFSVGMEAERGRRDLEELPSHG